MPALREAEAQRCLLVPHRDRVVDHKKEVHLLASLPAAAFGCPRVGACADVAREGDDVLRLIRGG